MQRYTVHLVSENKGNHHVEISEFFEGHSNTNWGNTVVPDKELEFYTTYRKTFIAILQDPPTSRPFGRAVDCEYRISSFTSTWLTLFIVMTLCYFTALLYSISLCFFLSFLAFSFFLFLFFTVLDPFAPR